MTDQWLDDTGLPIDGEWQPSTPCAPPGGTTSTIDNIVITGSPGGITSVDGNHQALWERRET